MDLCSSDYQVSCEFQHLDLKESHPHQLLRCFYHWKTEWRLLNSNLIKNLGEKKYVMTLEHEILIQVGVKFQGLPCLRKF